MGEHSASRRLPRRGPSEVRPAAKAAQKEKPPRPASADRRDRQKGLLARVRAAGESLRAIPSREVDALVIFGQRGTKVVTLKGGESAYRGLVEAMNEGAATVSSSGVVLYCNRSLGELLGWQPARLISMTLQSIVDPTETSRLEAFLRSARKQRVTNHRLKAVATITGCKPYSGQRPADDSRTKRASRSRWTQPSTRKSSSCSMF